MQPVYCTRVAFMTALSVHAARWHNISYSVFTGSDIHKYYSTVILVCFGHFVGFSTSIIPACSVIILKYCIIKFAYNSEYNRLVMSRKNADIANVPIANILLMLLLLHNCLLHPQLIQ